MLNQIFIAIFHNLLCVWRLQIAFRDQFTVTHRFKLPQHLRFLDFRSGIYFNYFYGKLILPRNVCYVFRLQSEKLKAYI